MKRVVLVVCDGLRADMVRPEWTPHICRLASGGRRFLNHRSVFPSTTRTTSASIATGCHPRRHGLEGNAVALDEGDGLVPLSAKAPDFRDRLRAATGRTLRVPTLAQRLAGNGGAIICSNVSAGAAYFQDPDGHGHVYHRAGSFGPGLVPLTGADGLDVSHDAAGDAAMTERFRAEVLTERRPALAVLWQCEPDHTQHAHPLGSPEHLAAIAAADANVGRVAEAVGALAAAGDDVLFAIASDHGHETVERVIDLEALMIEAGYKAGAGSAECVVTSQGASAFIYLADAARPKVAEIAAWLAGIDGVGAVYAGAELEALGQRSDGALAIAVDAAKSERANAFGIPGTSAAFANRFNAKLAPGHGEHGGLGAYEQNPLLILLGGGHAPGTETDAPSSAVDLAPTFLAHLGLPADGMDGRPLERR
ncbi:MAG: alkaline phosphatase family protein [Magnetovibrio sp.]|nr:alkaline phosphatase family protein [Magnetovibrio sp.]